MIATPTRKILRLKLKPKQRRSHTFTLALIGGAALVTLGAELFFGIVLMRVSRVEQRTESELAAAKRLHGPRTALLAGNSLPKADVDVPLLTGALGQEGIEFHRLVVEHTTYIDWYYGLRTLFAQGARPETVVFSMNSKQFTTREMRGDYSAYRLFQARDLVAAARDAGYSPTQTASLIVAHFSSFYGMRVEMRKWLLKQTVPMFEGLQPHLAPPPSAAQADRIVAIAPERIRALQALCASYGARLVLLAPAIRGEAAGLTAFRESAKAAAVDFIEPLAPNEAPESEWQDDMHMNPVGATRYTKALAPLLARNILQR